MKHHVLIGQTDYSALVFIPDPASTDGSGKTGLVAANLTVSGVRVETDNDVTVIDYTSALNDLAALTTAHTDWGIKEVSSTLAPGLYRIDFADAIFAAGAWSAVVYVMITASAAAASPMEFVLVAYDQFDGVRLGLNSLPNAAAEAAGGLFTRGSGAGQLNQQANGQIDVNLARWLNTAAAAPATAGVPKVAIEAAGDFAQGAADKVWSTATRTLTSLGAALVQEIWDRATSALTTAGSIGKHLVDNIDAAISSRLATAGYTAPPSVGAIADQVWDEALAGHLGAGSTGAALNAAGSAGDPWATALPGAYGAGTAGKIVGDALDAAISTRSTLDAAGVRTAVGLAAANLDTQFAALAAFIDTEVAAILADTDELQTDWVNGGRLDLLIDAIKAKVDALPTDPADESSIQAVLSTLVSFVDTEIAAIKAKTDLIPGAPAAVGSAMTLTSGERDSIASALLDLAAGIETGLTLRQGLRVFFAAMAGKSNSHAAGTPKYRNLADSKDRISATTDVDGNRTGVTLDLT